MDQHPASQGNEDSGGSEPTAQERDHRREDTIQRFHGILLSPGCRRCSSHLGRCGERLDAQAAPAPTFHFPGIQRDLAGIDDSRGRSSAIAGVIGHPSGGGSADPTAREK